MPPHASIIIFFKVVVVVGAVGAAMWFATDSLLDGDCKLDGGATAEDAVVGLILLLVES
jgi:hypothetical protein